MAAGTGTSAADDVEIDLEGRGTLDGVCVDVEVDGSVEVDRQLWQFELSHESSLVGVPVLLAAVFSDGTVVADLAPTVTAGASAQFEVETALGAKVVSASVVLGLPHQASIDLQVTGCLVGSEPGDDTTGEETSPEEPADVETPPAQAIPGEPQFTG